MHGIRGAYMHVRTSMLMHVRRTMRVIITPRRVCASGVKQLVLSVVRPSVMQVIL